MRSLRRLLPNPVFAPGERQAAAATGNVVGQQTIPPMRDSTRGTLVTYHVQTGVTVRGGAKVIFFEHNSIVRKKITWGQPIYPLPATPRIRG